MILFPVLPFPNVTSIVLLPHHTPPGLPLWGGVLTGSFAPPPRRGGWDG
ncbi:hypothetical protein [Spirosoma knui]